MFSFQRVFLSPVNASTYLLLWAEFYVARVPTIKMRLHHPLWTADTLNTYNTGIILEQYYSGTAVVQGMYMIVQDETTPARFITLSVCKREIMHVRASTTVHVQTVQ